MDLSPKLYTINRTLDRVVALLIDRPGITLEQMREIADTTSGIEDRTTKDVRILELADEFQEPAESEKYVA